MKSKYKVHLCDGCMKELENEWVYILPKSDVEIIRVATVEECDNYDLDNYIEKLSARNPDYIH